VVNLEARSITWFMKTLSTTAPWYDANSRYEYESVGSAGAEGLLVPPPMSACSGDMSL